MFNILLVEDEKLIREGLISTIEHLTPEFTVKWVADNGKRGLDFLQTAKPDVLITDIRMPLKDGLELIKQARLIYPDLQIIIISGYGEFSYAKTAMREGVKYYLLKPIRPAELQLALEAIAKDLRPSVETLIGNREDNSKVQKIKVFIREHLHEDISLQKIGEVVNLHPNYISTLFKQETGMKLSDYVVHERMEKAKDLLINSELKVYEIAFAVGYRDEKHFMHTFKKFEKCSPTKFRNMNITY